ncbi:MAG: hypothetical protein GKS00_03815 [Alphaproteobacteria bacterium]|nr:hypothetical protein [Alphaproteobacteria bacterium]
MTKPLLLLVGLAAGAALALPFGLVAQDVRPLGPGTYKIAVGESAAFAWRINTANGTVSVCAAPDDPASNTAPLCSPWGAGIISNPKR